MQPVPLADIPPHKVEALLDAAFGADRFGRTAYAIRRGMAAIPELSFALVQDGELIGTVQCWPIALKTEALDNSPLIMAPLIMVGPVAVHPAHQGAGHGRTLMDAAIAACEAHADALQSYGLMMIGDPDYYGRFWGFSADQTGQWQAPGPVERHRLLALSVRGYDLPMAGMLGPRV
jgi:predicted N-acetyltransferase YhbS